MSRTDLYVRNLTGRADDPTFSPLPSQKSGHAVRPLMALEGPFRAGWRRYDAPSVWLDRSGSPRRASFRVSGFLAYSPCLRGERRPGGRIDANFPTVSIALEYLNPIALPGRYVRISVF